MDFLKQIQKITYVNHISNEQAACYLSNYEDGYICHKHNGGCKNIDICRKIYEDERKNKIMPDEVLVSIEDQIIERFMDRLKELLFFDPRIHKVDAFYAVDNVNKAATSYDRLYKKNK